MMQTRILGIVGVSGSGKTTLEKKLAEEHPEIFNNLIQVSTRAMREGESHLNPYDFKTLEEFNELVKDNLLIAVIYPDSKFGTGYGTYKSNLEDDKVNTIILSEEGYLDLVRALKDGRLKEGTKLVVIGLDLETPPPSVREGRGEDFIEKEKKVLNYADKVIVIDPDSGRFAKPSEVLDILKHYDFL
jgi:hypothetical protein